MANFCRILEGSSHCLGHSRRCRVINLVGLLEASRDLPSNCADISDAQFAKFEQANKDMLTFTGNAGWRKFLPLGVFS